jgi:ADP-ribose pyrophosphatase
MANDRPVAPEVLRARIAYDGFVRVRVDEVRLASGKETKREVVEHPGAVAVLALTDDDRVLLVRQWRHAAGRALLEIPAGTKEPGESPAETARRELAEEAGYEPAALTEIASFYPTPGYSSERIFLYRADGCRKVDVSPDPDEGIALVQVPIADALGFLADPSRPIADGKTLIALLWLARGRC